MRSVFPFVAVLMLALLSACGTLPEAGPGLTPALPDATPFDANPIARMAYLDSYRDGYRSAAKGEIVSADFVRGPNQFARELGWRAGANAAQVDLEQGKVQPK